jgi:hypothetical protein
MPGKMRDLRQAWPVDGHVHFHELELAAGVLDAAAENFRAFARDPSSSSGGLLLAQAAGERVFEMLQARQRIGGWRISQARDEAQSLIAQRDGAMLAIVCGRQVRAADGLEVLALGTCRTFPDRLGFPESLAAVLESDALAVLPWGFGKWLGARRARVEAAAERTGSGKVFVGDNGGRLGLAGTPRLIASLRQRGFRVLPGTDPFPVGNDMQRVGRYGFLADVDPDVRAPWRRLRAWLESRDASPPGYGRTLGSIAFVTNQVGLRLRKFAPRRAAT